MKPKAIIKYTFTLFGETYPEWAECGDPLKYNVLSAREAKKIIREKDMVIVHSDENGTIWDTPDMAWTKVWKGIFEKRRIEKVEYNRQKRIRERNLKLQQI